MMPRFSGNFRKVSKKPALVESFWYKTAALESQPSVLLKEGHYHRCFLSWKIFESGWLLIARSEKYETVAFDIYQILTMEILSAVIFYNVFITLNVNKKILKIDLSEPTPYRISMLVSFLEDLTQIIFLIQSSRINNWLFFF